MENSHQELNKILHLQEQNRKLLLEIRVLTTSGLTFEKLMVINKYRENIKEESAINDLVRFSELNYN